MIEILGAGFKRKRLVSIVYFIQLILAITIGLQVFQVMNASIGDSISLQGLQLGNAHMVINDLLNVHGSSLSPLLGQVRWMIICYLIIASFIHAGTWYCLIKKHSTHGFWIGGATYFWKCLIIGVFHLIIFVFWTAILWLPYLSKTRYWMEYLPNEAPILWIGVGVFILWMIGTSFLFVASSVTKIFVIRHEFSLLVSIKKALIFTVKKIVKLFPVLILFALALVFFYSIHMWIDEMPIMSTSVGIFLLFVVQQGIVWSKIALRISTYNYLLNKV